MQDGIIRNSYINYEGGWLSFTYVYPKLIALADSLNVSFTTNHPNSYKTMDKAEVAVV